MDDATAQRLIELNRQFYVDHAASFARSRGTGQAGLLQTLPFVPATPRILDLGCGNGRLARFLAGHRAGLTYVGVDASLPLLAIARRLAQGLPGVTAHLVGADLLASDHPAGTWTTLLPSGLWFDAVYLLAVVHHVPGFGRRAQVLRAAADVLSPNGVLIVSYWQFLDDPQQRAKIVPWPAIGLQATQVEPGDALLAWQRDAPGLRYCHHVDTAEAEGLAQTAGLDVLTSYYADGRSRRLNFFQVCRRTASSEHAAD